MSDIVWIVALGVALLGGAGAAVAVTRGRLLSSFETRLDDATRKIERQQAKQLEQLTAARRQVELELQQQRSVIATQKAELAKLEMHLVSACDELERLRASSSPQNTSHDTSQGYAATLPMQLPGG